ncbi:MAG TPA: EAL domain-containing protein [Catenuloplanes sp.]|jgi:diguanylate cyclase (GGDEF)-like protein
MHSNALSTQRLAEFLAVVSAAADVPTAIRVATERAARVLEAEVAALLDETGVITSVGFVLGRAPVAELFAVVRDGRALQVPGAGRCHTLVAPLGGAATRHLVVARSGAEGFSIDELSLLRGMARVLELTIATLHTLQELRQRQRLLEQLSIIQRAITRRAPLRTILDAITEGARELLGDDLTALHVVDPDDPDMVLLVASTGLPEELRRRLWRIPGGNSGVAGEAARRDELVVYDSGGVGPAPIPGFAPASIRAAMAAPVHENSTVVGSLVVASQRSGRVYSPADRDVLAVFAEHVSLAIADAKTQEAMAQAFHDSLTGLASRALFLDRLNHALARAAHERTPLGVLFVDLDRFKTVNDSLGHSAGDALLVDVADRLRSCLGASDTAARLGGDEFVVLCERCDPGAVTATAKKIIKRLRDPFLIQGHETFIDASIGIVFNNGGSQSAADLIRDADLAMYQAKKNGKGRYEIFRPELRTTFLRSLDIEARLRQAIDRDDLVLRYQPIVSLRDGSVVGTEALVRWRDGQRNIVLPSEFIPLAEETGLILAIDRWVLQQACGQGAAWNRRPGAPPVTMSVNLSARQLQHPGLAELVSAVLNESGLDPARLVLEITESRLMHDTEATTERLRQLKTLGVRVAIDDFGTGHSSLAYLRQFPVDIMKIDKSFMTGVDPGSPDATLTRAIVALGRTLRLTTIAEGVETAAQADDLRTAGCHLAQGFHFAAPLDAGQVERMTDRVRTPGPPDAPWLPGRAGSLLT